MRKTRRSVSDAMSNTPCTTCNSLLVAAMRSATAGVVGAWFVVGAVGGFTAWTVRLSPRLVWTLQGFETGVPHGADGLIPIGSVRLERGTVPWHDGEIELFHIHNAGDPARAHGVALPLDQILRPEIESFACTVRSMAYEESKLMLCPAMLQTEPAELVFHREARCIIPTYEHSLGAVNSSLPVTFSRLHPPATHLYVGSTGSPINQAIIDLLFYDVTALARHSRS